MSGGETGLEAVASAFFSGGMLGEELDANLDEELGVDLDGELEVDEDESSACAPYLARQMSCFGSRTPGVSEICTRNWEYLRVSSKGLNTKSINLNVPRRRCSSSWLRNNTAEKDAQCYPGSGPS